jgi:quercetin 2,3-dioxygenase
MLPDEVRGRLDRAFPDSGALAGAGGESGGGEHQRAERSMTLTESFIVRRNAGEPGPWQVLAGGARTAGSVMFGEARLPARSTGPGLHIHTREDEAAYVISGVLTFVVGDRRFEASAGELVWLPRQVPHTFANLGDEPVWAFGVTTPAGLEGMFEDQRAYFAGLQGAPDPDRIREIGARYGVRSLGPPISLE